MPSTPPLVELQDFWDWVEESDVDAAEANRVRMYLAAASGIVRTRARRTWIDENGLLEEVPAEIAFVVLQMVERKWRNPEGVVHEATGPFSNRYSENVAAGLYLTDEEQALCDSKRPTGGLGVIQTTRGDEGPLRNLVATDAGRPIDLGDGA